MKLFHRNKKNQTDNRQKELSAAEKEVRNVKPDLNRHDSFDSFASLIGFDLSKTISRVLGDLPSLVASYHQLMVEKRSEKDLAAQKQEIFEYLTYGILWVMISADDCKSSCYATAAVIDRILEIGNNVKADQIRNYDLFTDSLEMVTIVGPDHQEYICAFSSRALADEALKRYRAHDARLQIVAVTMREILSQAGADFGVVLDMPHAMPLRQSDLQAIRSAREGHIVLRNT